MAYNKARAEKEWLEWKNDEETKLRKLGVDEDTIQRLHTYDWESFKADRNYQRWTVGEDQLSEQPAHDIIRNVRNIEQLMDNIENKDLFETLKSADRKTLQILIYKMSGYTSKEIETLMGIPELAINSRMARIRKKFKNIF